MGNCKSNLIYINESKSILEKKLRMFESNVLIDSDSKVEQQRSFSSIYSLICYDSELFQGKNKSNLEKFLVSNFTEKMTKFVLDNSYFKTTDDKRLYEVLQSFLQSIVAEQV